MCWIEDKPKGIKRNVGRPQLPAKDKRLAIRPTVHPKIKKALADCKEADGRIIDKAVSKYLGITL